MPKADLVINNGNVLTLDDRQPHAEAVAACKGKIIAVGDTSTIEELIGSETKIIDAEGKTVLPGFHDGHLHFIGYGLTLQMVQLSGVNSIEEIKRRVNKAAMGTAAGEWIIGTGWDHNLFEEGRYLNRQDLDEACPSHPVLLTRICGHLQAVNTKALGKADIGSKTPDPPGGKIDREADGYPSGILRETATRKVMEAVPPPTSEKLQKALKLAVSKAHSCGLTSVTTDDIRSDRVGTIDDNMRLYHNMWESGDPPVRVTLELRDLVIEDILQKGLRTGQGSDRVKVGNLKVFQDGALGARTAFLRNPYEGETEDRGIPIHEQEALNERIAKGHKAGLQVAVHAIGDAAIDSCLDAFEKAAEEAPRSDTRHRIIHYCIVDESILKRTKKMGIVADIQPTFVPLNGQWVERLLGEKMAKMTYPWKTILEYGIPCAGSSDCPITPIEPLLGIWAAVTRHRYYSNDSDVFLPEEKLSVVEALKLYTKDAAYADFDEDKKGTLSPGKYADMVMLEEDPCQIDPDRIKDLEVAMTLIDGRVVYEKI